MTRKATKARKIGYKQQSATFKERYGEEAYAANGSKGGRNRPKITSEQASEMSKRSWELRRARKAQKENQENERTQDS